MASTDDTQLDPKAAAAVKDYGIKWADWLAGDTILSSTWATATGITIDSDIFTADTTTAIFSGGTNGKTYDAVNTIVTLAGRTEQRTIRIRVQAT